MISKNDIEHLFDFLWPAMLYADKHKANCLKNLNTINNCFKKFEKDHNKLLNSLSTIEGIGLTIGSGLIWVKYPQTRVPFDKYTLTYALDLGIIPSNNISQNYLKYCEKIHQFCSNYEIDEDGLGVRKYEIEDFVREAMEELSGEYFSDPK